MNIRRLKLPDVDILLRIEKATLGRDALNRSSAEMVLRCGKVFGAFLGGKLAGTIEILFGKNPNDVFLWGYGVLPEYRSQGVAVALRKAAIQESIKRHRSLLYGEIHIRNFPSIARRLEEKGAFIVDYFPDFYRKDEDWFSAVTKLDIKTDIARGKEIMKEKIRQNSVIFAGSNRIRHRQELFNGSTGICAIVRTEELGMDSDELGPSIFVFGPLPEELQNAKKIHRPLPLAEVRRLVRIGNQILPSHLSVMEFRLIEEFGDLICVPDTENPRAMATIIYDSDPAVAHVWHFGAEAGFLRQLKDKIREVSTANGRKYIKYIKK